MSTALCPLPGRTSDAFRLGLAVVVVAVSIPVMKANSAVELSIVHAVHPPPAAISWLVTTVFWIGSAGVSVLQTDRRGGCGTRKYDSGW